MIPLVFAIVYIAVDILYVLLSRDVYMDVVKTIQKGEHTSFDNTRIIAALGAYTLMAVGWLILVAPAVTVSMHKGSSPLWSGFVPGFTFGIVLYGVFNFTNYVMFQNYTYRIVIQDMLWGSLWVTCVSIAFAYYLHRNAGSYTHRH